MMALGKCLFRQLHLLLIVCCQCDRLCRCNCNLGVCASVAPMIKDIVVIVCNSHGVCIACSYRIGLGCIATLCGCTSRDQCSPQSSYGVTTESNCFHSYGYSATSGCCRRCCRCNV